MNNSGVNTIILVLIVILIVFGMVWFFKGGDTEPEENGLNIELNIPSDDGDDDQG